MAAIQEAEAGVSADRTPLVGYVILHDCGLNGAEIAPARVFLNRDEADAECLVAPTKLYDDMRWPRRSVTGYNGCEVVEVEIS